MKVPSFSSTVAVLAHPDDIKSVAGVVLRALANGCTFSLISITKGEALAPVPHTPAEVAKIRQRDLLECLRRC